jgi:predicted XRE-type DNA-binding protein
MSTTTSRGTFDQPAAPVLNPRRPRRKIMRIAAMTRKLLDEVRAQRLDASGAERLRAIDTQTIRELETDLAPELCRELRRLALPLTSHAGLSDAELRIAHVQLAGWLEGLLETMQPAEYRPDLAPASAVPSATGRSTCGGGPTNADPTNAAVLAARRTLITAITTRITKKRLTAAQAASALRLTGPKVTKLFEADLDEFSLDELVTLLPRLGLAMQVVPVPEQ